MSGTAATDGCLCYTTDASYALPTLLSATQAKENLPSHIDVVVLIVGATSTEMADLIPAHAAADIILVDVPCDAVDGLSIQFARHFLDRLLDQRYRRVVHLDGDTHILGSLNSLLETDIAPGRLLAVPDPLALLATTDGFFWRDHRQRFSEIGLGSEAARRYANTGIFCARRDDLAGIGEACRALALREGSRLRFGEQDAFNIVLGSAIDLISLRWNYPAFFSNFRFGHLVEPRVRHFMSNPRPWQGSFPPWGRAGQAPYIDLVRRFPELARFLLPLSTRKRLRYEVQQRLKRHVEPVFWDTAHIRDRIAEHERSAVV